MRVNVSMPVSGGYFLLTDYEEYSEFWGKDITLSEATLSLAPESFKGPATIAVEPGYFTITTTLVGHTTESETARMHIPSGKLLVADMARVVDPHKWHKFLQETECMTKFRSSARSRLINTGGSCNVIANLRIQPL